MTENKVTAWDTRLRPCSCPKGCCSAYTNLTWWQDLQVRTQDSSVEVRIQDWEDSFVKERRDRATGLANLQLIPSYRVARQKQICWTCARGSEGSSPSFLARRQGRPCDFHASFRKYRTRLHDWKIRPLNCRRRQGYDLAALLLVSYDFPTNTG